MLSGAKSVVQDRLLVNKVTSTTNQPVGGPQLDEIKFACDESEARCKSLVDLLIQRLAKDNPVIKLKCMRIIEYVSTSGKPIFSVEMMKHMNELKAAAAFTGAPDPLRGMEPYKALHDQAHTTIEQVASRVNGGSRKPQNGLFNTISRPGQATAPMARGAHIGLNKPAAPAAPAAVAPKAMAGMGNEAVQKQPANNWQDKAQNLGRPTLNNFAPRGVAQPRGPVNTTATSTSTSNTNYIPKPVGPRGAVNGQQQQQQPASGYKAPTGGFTIAQRNQANAGKANTDGTYERGLVNELCAPGGMKPVPPADKLEIFVRNCRNIPADIIAPLLLAKLSEDSYQVQLKALCVVEALCKQEGCEDYLEYFKENQEEIAELGIKGNKAVCKKADSVITLIERGGEDEPEEEEEPDAPPPPRRVQPQPQPQQQELPAEEIPPEEDLMAGGGGDDLFNIMPSEPEAPPAPAVDEGALFDGLTTEVVNKSVVDNFDFQSIPPTNVPSAAAGGGDDLFGNIDFGGQPSMTMNTAPSQPQHNVMNQSGGDDAFGYFDNVKPANPRGRSRGSSAGIDLNAIPSYNPGMQGGGYGMNVGGYNMPPAGGMQGGYGMNPNMGMPPPGQGGYGMPPQGGMRMQPGGMPGGGYGMNPGMGMPPQGGYGMPPQGGMAGGYGMQQPPQGGMGYGMNTGMGMNQGMGMQPPPQPPKQPDQFANLLPDF